MKDLTVKHYMRHQSLSFNKETLLQDVVDKLLDYGISGAPVVDDKGHLVGFVSEQDCIRKLMTSAYYCEGVPTVAEVMSTEVKFTHPDETILTLADRLVTDTPKIYPVIEDDQLVGLVTRGDILKALREHLTVC